MKITAVICEFNPFHNGHKRIIDEARRLGADTVVVCDNLVFGKPGSETEAFSMLHRGSDHMIWSICAWVSPRLNARILWNFPLQDSSSCIERNVLFLYCRRSETVAAGLWIANVVFLAKTVFFAYWTIK